jgi:hypothetical protein
MTVHHPHSPSAGRMLALVVAFGAVFVFLAVTPAPVTFPDSAWEAALLLKGAIVLLAVNAWLLLREAPAVRRVLADAPTPANVVAYDSLTGCIDYHVIVGDETLGIVEDLPLARDGVISGILVSQGWLRARRVLVQLDEVRRIDHDSRVVELFHPRLDMAEGGEGNR